MNKLFLVFAALILTFGFGLEGKAQRNHRKHFYKRRSRQMSNHMQRQSFDKEDRKFAVGLAMGPANYFGDLAPRPTRTSFDASLTHLNIHAFVQQRVHYNVSWRVSAGWVHLQGSDFSSADWEEDATTETGPWRYLRNLHFRNNMFELTATGLFDIFGHHGNAYTRHPVAPYGILGVAALFHNPQARAPLAGYSQSAYGEDWDGEWVNLKDLGSAGEDYSQFQIAFPVGLGVHYRASHKIDIGLEISYRFTLTDYLDDVGGNEFMSDEELSKLSPLGRAMHNRSGEPDGFGFNPSGADDRNLNEVFNSISNDISGQPGSEPTFEQVPLFDEDGNIIPDAQNGRRIGGFEEGGHPRGNEANDVYILTQVQVKYILGTTHNRKPKFR